MDFTKTPSRLQGNNCRRQTAGNCTRQCENLALVERNPGVCTRCSTTYSWVKPPGLAWGTPRSQPLGHHRDSPAACDPGILQHLCKAHHDARPRPCSSSFLLQGQLCTGEPLARLLCQPRCTSRRVPGRPRGKHAGQQNSSAARRSREQPRGGHRPAGDGLLSRRGAGSGSAPARGRSTAPLLALRAESSLLCLWKG